MCVQTIKQTLSIVGQHIEPQENPPMSQIKVVETKTNDIMALLPNRLIMDIIQIVDGGRNTHKQKFSKCMTEFKALNGLDWIQQGCCIEEAFQLEQYLPKCVFEGVYGYEVDENLDVGETIIDFQYAKMWVDRLS